MRIVKVSPRFPLLNAFALVDLARQSGTYSSRGDRMLTFIGVLKAHANTLIHGAIQYTLLEGHMRADFADGEEQPVESANS